MWQPRNTVVIMTNAGSGVLQAGQVLPVGTAASSIAGGDLDGDGDLDLITTNAGSDNVSVLINQGPGAFSSLATTQVGDTPNGLDVGDFNGDQQLDVAVSNGGSDTISVLLGVGDGSFRPAPATYPSGGHQPSSVMVSDLNDDSEPDLVVTDAGSDQLAVLIGVGDGTFQPPETWPTSTPVSPGEGPGAAASGDFDGDGHTDIAVLNVTSATVSIFAGAGDGTLSPVTGLVVGPASVWLVADDLDNDQRPDLAAASATTSTVWVWQNATDFPLGTPLALPPGADRTTACGHGGTLVGRVRSTGLRSNWRFRFRQPGAGWRSTPRQRFGPDDDALMVRRRVGHLRPGRKLVVQVVVASQGEQRRGRLTRTMVRRGCHSPS